MDMYEPMMTPVQQVNEGNNIVVANKDEETKADDCEASPEVPEEDQADEHVEIRSDDTATETIISEPRYNLRRGVREGRNVRKTYRDI